MTEHYDLESVYDEQIAPLMEKIIGICKEHGMPMVASFAYASSDEAEDCCTTSIPVEGRTPEKFKAAIDRLMAPTLTAFTITTAKK